FPAAGRDRPRLDAPDRSAVGAYPHLRPPARARLLPAGRLYGLRTAAFAVRGSTGPGHPAAHAAPSAPAAARLILPNRIFRSFSKYLRIVVSIAAGSTARAAHALSRLAVSPGLRPDRSDDGA